MLPKQSRTFACSRKFSSFVRGHTDPGRARYSGKPVTRTPQRVVAPESTPVARRRRRVGCANSSVMRRRSLHLPWKGSWRSHRGRRARTRQEDVGNLVEEEEQQHRVLEQRGWLRFRPAEDEDGEEDCVRNMHADVEQKTVHRKGLLRQAAAGARR